MSKIALLFFLLAIARADSTYQDSFWDGVRDKGIRLNAGNFNEEHLEELARMELSRQPRAYSIRLTMVGDRGGLPLPKPDHYGFETWSTISAGSSFTNEIAEMISIGDDAVLRVRDGAKLTEKVLSGTNPLDITLDGRKSKIVWLVVDSYNELLHVFVSTPMPTAVDGAAILEYLRPLFGNYRVLISIEETPRFVGSGDYPFVNPFTEREPLPTKDEYTAIKQLTCQYVAEVPTCQ